MTKKEGRFQIYYNKLDGELQKLIQIYGTNNKTELQEKIKARSLEPFDEKPKQTLSQRLKDLKLQLECWKLLKEQKYSLKDSIEIIEGKKSIAEPSLQLLQQLPKTNPETAFEQQSPYDEANRRVQCTDCGILFSGLISEQTEAFCDHLYQKHNRAPTKFEVECCKQANKDNPRLYK